MADATEHTQNIPSSEAVISIKGLHKAFGDNKVINGFDFDLKRGENVVVLGKSGSGKSVLIKLIIGLMK
jgi:phospholipid/cholesterol/gamma-HCH transport system ATP-binding protein